MKLKLQAIVLFFVAIIFSTNAQTSLNESAARAWITSHAKELKIKNTDVFNLSFVRKSISGETLRFQQMVHNVPVINSELVIHFNPDNEITSTTNSYMDKDTSISTIPTLNKEQAIEKAKQTLNNKEVFVLQKCDLVINSQLPEAKLVYKIISNSSEGVGSWEVLIDAQTGNVLSKRDVAIYHHKNKSKKKEEEPKKENENKKEVTKSTLAFVSGTAMIFNPDPLSVAQTTYTGSYVDGNNATNTALDAARSLVTLPEIDLTAGVYKLKSSFVEIKDIEAPSRGLFTQATSAFSFNRSQYGFEAANAFYHLDNSMRYINTTLGIICRPSLNSGIFFFDPSGANGADNSYYMPNTEQIVFGEGGVDDAEDADVVLHEFGHGIHDWITNGSTPGNVAGDVDDGLGEGNGDYWAQSYSRSLNQWATTNAAYQKIFNWDGPAWGSTRNTNYSLNYPAGVLMSDNHMDGQIWSTAMMKIWDAIGRVKTDKAFLEGLSYTDHTATQQKAAIAVRQAAIDMNYSCADITTITVKFVSKGYTLPALSLTMASIANQTVAADATNTYTLPSYATLANPISAACAATLTQSPIVGTVLAPGVYTITMTATLGTSVVVRSFSLTVTPNLAVAQNVKENVVIYPNPAKNQITIKGEFDTNESITIYNILGQKVMEKASISNEEKVDVSKLSNGIYTIYFNTSKASYKFIKE